jgi:hypothetical protein
MKRSVGKEMNGKERQEIRTTEVYRASDKNPSPQMLYFTRTQHSRGTKEIQHKNKDANSSTWPNATRYLLNQQIIHLSTSFHYPRCERGTSHRDATRSTFISCICTHYYINFVRRNNRNVFMAVVIAAAQPSPSCLQILTAAALPSPERLAEDRRCWAA